MWILIWDAGIQQSTFAMALPSTHGLLEVVGDCQCEAVFAEAIPLFTEETASQKPLAVTSRAEFYDFRKTITFNL
jgi:hypothetical protein